MNAVGLPKIVLGSSSSARRSLMQVLELPFETFSPDVDERLLTGEAISAAVVRLALAKVEKVAQHFKNALIIGCDQLGVVNEFVLSKPNNHADAVQQLKRQSGQLIKFYTAVVLYDMRREVIQKDVVRYNVQFRELTDQEIEDYLEKVKPYHCAGSLSVEGLGITLLDKLSGDDYTALIGLPLISLSRMLRNAGVSLYQ